MGEAARRRGRPTIDDPRNRTRTFRITEKECEKLGKISRATGKSEPDVIRKALDIYAKLLDLD